MNDITSLLIVAGFAFLMWLLLRLCEWLMEAG
jgi:hypothetical protein